MTVDPELIATRIAKIREQLRHLARVKARSLSPSLAQHDHGINPGSSSRRQE